MLFSRFWYVVLVLIGIVGMSFTLLSSSVENRASDAALTEALKRDRFEMEMMLRHDARIRIDELAPVAAQQDVRTALRTASDQASVAQNERLTERLRVLNTNLNDFAGDVLMATDRRGRVVAQIGMKVPPAGSSLSEIPLVEQALAGFLRDDVWVLGEVPYRMAARPVIDNGAYVGAIVHGMRLDDRFAEKLAKKSDGSTIAFFVGPKIVGRHMSPEPGAARAEDTNPGIAAAIKDPRFAEGKASDPVDVSGAARAVYSPVTGSAAALGVGYAIARPRKVLAPMDVFGRLTQDDKLSPSLMALLGGAALLLFLIGMLAIWLERDRPVAKLIAGVKHAGAKVAEGERLAPAAYSGRYRALAVAINDALDGAVAKAGQAKPVRRAADLQEILGATPEEPTVGPGFFGFSEAQAPSPPLAEIRSVLGGPKPAPKTKTPDDALTASAAAATPGSSPSAKGAPVPAPPKGPPAMKGPAPRPPGPPAPPPGSQPKAPAFGAAPAKSSLAEDDYDEPATTVAQIPDELLREVTKNQAKALSREEADEAHFREVFDKFIVTKRQCAESTDGVTYDRFVQTLRKNREGILSKPGVSNVVFTVYVKDGKAALRATPVK